VVSPDWKPNLDTSEEDLWTIMSTGAKNHDGSQSRRGTEVAALFYSAIESAKLAGVEPKAYLHAAPRAPRPVDPIPLPHTLAAVAPDRRDHDGAQLSRRG
jgi:hypothetical protein